MHGHACCTPAAHIAVGLGVRMGHVDAHGWPSTCRWGCAGGVVCGVGGLVCVVVWCEVREGAWCVVCEGVRCEV